MFSNVDLPLPDGPSKTTNSPDIDQDRHPQGVNIDFADVIELGHAVNVKYGLPVCWFD
jgi:hypothetical protein